MSQLRGRRRDGGGGRRHRQKERVWVRGSKRLVTHLGAEDRGVGCVFNPLGRHLGGVNTSARIVVEPVTNPLIRSRLCSRGGSGVSASAAAAGPACSSSNQRESGGGVGGGAGVEAASVGGDGGVGLVSASRARRRRPGAAARGCRRDGRRWAMTSSVRPAVWMRPSSSGAGLVGVDAAVDRGLG